MEVKVRNLTKTYRAEYGDVTALQGLSFTVRDGEFYTLLGPSGCGKSTTLRCIAGLERANDGEIAIGDMVVAGPRVWVPPDKRPIGMVFQSYAIWPHMTVFKNVEFPLRQRNSGLPRSERKDRVMEALSLVQMEHLADRPAPYLSGGQQQRVALARALVSRPQVLLLDEPLSNLDAKLREELRVEIKDLTKRMGITAIYVTHDQLEALAMSDRVAVMEGGRILQEAGPKDIYLRPTHSFVAQFVGQVNFFEGSIVEATGSGRGVIDTVAGKLACTIPAGVGAGAKVAAVVRPECLQAAAEPGNGYDGNVLEGKVEKAVFLGDAVDCQAIVGSKTIHAKLAQSADLAPGDRIFLRFAAEDCIVLPRNAE